MYTLTTEQAEVLVQMVMDHCPSAEMSRGEFAEVVNDYFENIPGFETIPPIQADEIINQLWGMVMSKKEAAVGNTSKPEISKEAEIAVVIDLTKPTIQKAIAEGKALIAEGKTKADAARVMYPQISNESKEMIIAAFVEGATLTPKGAQTYWYNCRRRASKEKKPAQ
ncbi:hypothetical protein [Herminiimonas arsenitoxidans]|uniref:hypothetical protein n=1 Tax=Herminiimonas arsenitoxidans TaxID=1809410 RepID=UPI0018D48545|nr:hypothetical protein [Herminiimonas arsenitoxidans]